MTAFYDMITLATNLDTDTGLSRECAAPSNSCKDAVMRPPLHFQWLTTLAIALVFGAAPLAADPGRKNPWCFRGTFKDQGDPPARYPLSADGKRLLCVGSDGQARVYSLATGAKLF